MIFYALLVGAISSACLLPSGANAAAKSQIQSVAIKEDDGQATIDILFTGTPEFTSTATEGRIEVDLPDSIWTGGVAQSGPGTSLVISYRRQASARGSRIVFKTSAPLRIVKSGLLPDAGQSPTLEITLRRQSEEAPVYVPDIGPVVTQSSGILYAPVMPASPASQVAAPAVQPSVQCTATTSKSGSFDGAPVYSFSKCK